MRKFAIAVTLVCGTAVPLKADVLELSVKSDACAIWYALTLKQHDACPKPAPLGLTRAIDEAPDQPAAPMPKPAVSAAHKSWAENGYYIHFDFGSDELDTTYQDHLASLSNVLLASEMRDLCVKFVGHTDAVGGEALNKALSERRAMAVYDFMIGPLGMRADRLLSIGMGESKTLPEISPTDARNRRVEILARKVEGGDCSAS